MKATTTRESLPPPADVAEVEEILGYEFRERRLLEEAFTDPSWPETAEDGGAFSYERLEYVGDSVLNLLVTREQFLAHPNLSPGALTRLRAANVDTEKLARVAVKLGLQRYLRHNKLHLYDQRHACESPFHLTDSRVQASSG